MQSCLFENGILRKCQFTPGLLSASRKMIFGIEWFNGFVLVSNPAPIFAIMLKNQEDVKFIGVGAR